MFSPDLKYFMHTEDNQHYMEVFTAKIFKISLIVVIFKNSIID